MSIDNRETLTAIAPEKLSRREYSSCLVVLMGPPLSGKTTIGKALADSSNFSLLDVDEIRHTLYPPESLSPQRYTDQQEQEIMDTVYATAFNLAEQKIKNGTPVIISGTFHGSRGAEIAKLADSRTPTVIFRLGLESTDEESAIAELSKRLAQRLTSKNTRSNILDLNTALRLKKGHKTDPNLNPIFIDTNRPPKEVLQEVLTKLSPLEK